MLCVLYFTSFSERRGTYFSKAMYMYRTNGPTLFQSLSLLWNVLMAAADDLGGEKLFVLFDALEYEFVIPKIAKHY